MYYLKLIVALLMFKIHIVLTYMGTGDMKKHLLSYLDACWIVQCWLEEVDGMDCFCIANFKVFPFTIVKAGSKNSGFNTDVGFGE